MLVSRLPRHFGLDSAFVPAPRSGPFRCRIRSCFFPLIWSRPDERSRRTLATREASLDVKGRITDTVLSAQLRRFHASLIFLDHPNDLFTTKSAFKTEKIRHSNTSNSCGDHKSQKSSSNACSSRFASKDFIAGICGKSLLSSV